MIYLFTLLWVYGYCTEPANSDEPDYGSPGSNQDTRIKTAFISFLGHFGFFGSEESDSPPKVFQEKQDDRRQSDPAPTTSTPVIQQPLLANLDETGEAEVESSKLSKALNLESTSKLVTMSDTPKLMHPGISKLQTGFRFDIQKECYTK